MAEEKATLLLSNEVYRQIMWFTKNFDKEIGALGVGDIESFEGKKHFYIEKLLFPKQVVSGATVHFTPDMWGDLIKNHPDDMKRICFYWHRHPGSARHSGTDEDDTFGTFMDDKAGRKWFAFLQTAWTHDGKLDKEARIDIRSPIRVTIPNSCVSLMYKPGLTEEKVKKLTEGAKKEQEKEIKEFAKLHHAELYNFITSLKTEETCKTIAKDCIIEKVIDDWKEKVGQAIEKNHNSFDLRNEEGLKQLFQNVEVNYMDNESLNGVQVSVEEQAGVEMINGGVSFNCGKLFEEFIKISLEKGGKLDKFVRSYKVDEAGTMKKYRCQPQSKCYKELVTSAKEVFVEFNKMLLEKWRKETTDTLPAKINHNYYGYDDNDDYGYSRNFNKTLEQMNDTQPQQPKQMVTNTNTSYIFTGEPEIVDEMLTDLGVVFDIDWKDNYIGVACKLGDKSVVGSVFISKDKKRLHMMGKGVIDTYHRLKIGDGALEQILNEQGYELTYEGEEESSPLKKKDNEKNPIAF